MAERAYTHHLISETDFFIKEDLMDGVTHALIVNVSGASNLPSYLLAAFRDDMKTVGHMSSKHSLTQPHRVLCEAPPTWPILRYGNTLFIIVNGPRSSPTSLRRNATNGSSIPSRPRHCALPDGAHGEGQVRHGSRRGRSTVCSPRARTRTRTRAYTSP